MRTLVGVEVELGRTWPCHGKTWPIHGLKIRHSIDYHLIACWLSLENFSALADLEHTFPAGAGAGEFGFYLV